MAKKTLLDRLNEGIVLGDGGYLLALENRGYVQAGPFTPEVTVENPNALRALHEEFVHAGAEVLQVLAFYASENKLAQIGYAGRLREINEAAVRIAHEAARSDTLIAGDICLTWKYQPDDASSRDEVRSLFDRQLEYQLSAGDLDFVVGETFLWAGEAILALERIKAAGKTAMVTLAFESATTKEGLPPGDAARMLEDAGADVVGVNCWTDPAHMLPLVKQMREAVSCHVAAQPVAYRCTDEVPFFVGQTGFPDRLDDSKISRYELGDFARQAAGLGINYIGGCCGCEGSHIRQMARALGRMPEEMREWSRDDGSPQSATENYQALRESQRG
jgi:betaine-homocysteine S-methyltransferase